MTARAQGARFLGPSLLVLSSSLAALEAERPSEALPFGRTVGTVARFQLAADRSRALRGALGNNDTGTPATAAATALRGKMSPG